MGWTKHLLVLPFLASPPLFFFLSLSLTLDSIIILFFSFQNAFDSRTE
jgi:hypothetical protein